MLVSVLRVPEEVSSASLLDSVWCSGGEACWYREVGEDGLRSGAGVTDRIVLGDLWSGNGVILRPGLRRIRVDELFCVGLTCGGNFRTLSKLRPRFMISLRHAALLF